MESQQDGLPLRLIDLDPARVWLEVPAATHWPSLMSAFLRQLARQAAGMARRLDELVIPAVPSAEAGGPVESGRSAAGGRGRHTSRPLDVEGGRS
jgi:hypothetical protein